MSSRRLAVDSKLFDSASPGRLWRALAGALGLALWLLWCTRVAQMPEHGFRLSANQLAWLLALPLLSMAVARVLGTLMPPLLAGSHWTLWGTAGLLPLATAVGRATDRPGTAFEWLVLLAIACGLAVGLFAAALVPVSAGLAQQSRVLRLRGMGRLCASVAGGLGGMLGLAAVLPWLATQWWPQGVDGVWAAIPLALVGWAAAAAMGRRLGAVRSARWAFGGAALAWLGLALAPALALVSEAAPALARAVAMGVLLPASGLAAGASVERVSRAFGRTGADAAAAVGFATGIGAFGAFVVPKLLGSSVAATGSLTAGLVALSATQLACWLAIPPFTSGAAASSRNL
jgi:nitrate/nitrite transporter NarK